MAPTFVQSNDFSEDASAATIPTTGTGLAYTSANSAGNLLVAVASWGTGGGVPTSATATDTQGNTWAMLKFQDYTTDSQCVALFAAYNCKAGANAVKLALTSTDFRRLTIGEYSGVTASPLDGTVNSTSGTGTTTTNGISGGSTTTTVAGDLIIGAIEQTFEDATIVAGSSPLAFTIRDGIGGMRLEDAVAGAAGAYAANWTVTGGSNQHYAAITAAFKAAAAPGGSPKNGQFFPFFM